MTSSPFGAADLSCTEIRPRSIACATVDHFQRNVRRPSSHNKRKQLKITCVFIALPRADLRHTMAVHTQNPGPRPPTGGSQPPPATAGPPCSPETQQERRLPQPSSPAARFRPATCARPAAHSVACRPIHLRLPHPPELLLWHHHFVSTKPSL